MSHLKDATMKDVLDPQVAALTPEKVERDITEYLQLLDDQVTEHLVHQFLANHSYFFNSMLRLGGYCPLYSKIKLGSEFEVDFAWFDTSSFGPEWHLAEIEPPKAKLLNKAGNPTAELTHAIGQIRNWNSWVHQNLAYAQNLMSQIERPYTYIFMGRRNTLTNRDKKKLKAIEFEHRHLFKLRTLDYFKDSARSVINLMGGGGKGNWRVPMVALCHSDLNNGLPPEAMTWMQHYASPEVAEKFSELRDIQKIHHSESVGEFDSE